MTSRSRTARIRSGIWESREGVELYGKTLGVVGVGGIGREVARIAGGIGMKVIGWNRTPREDAGVAMVDLDTLLARSDVISLNLLLTEETRSFLDAAPRRAGQAGRHSGQHGARCAGRGGGADRGAGERRIRHAGLDVFHAEPLQSGHALARMDNVTLSPHAAFRTPEASRNLLRRALDILRSIQGLLPVGG